MKAILRMEDHWDVTQETVIRIKLQVKPLMPIFLNGITTAVCILQRVFEQLPSRYSGLANDSIISMIVRYRKN